MDVSDVSMDSIETYVVKRNKINILMKICVFIFLLILLFLEFILSIFLLKLIFITYLLMVITNIFFNDENKKSNNLLYHEILFSRNISDQIYQYHLKYLIDNLGHYLHEPEMMDRINIILFSLFNSNLKNNSDICELNKAVLDILTIKYNELDIPCRDIIFDYIDNMICLNGMNVDKKEIVVLLNRFISNDWDIKLPTIYLKRHFELMEHINSNIQSEFIKGYSLFYNK